MMTFGAFKEYYVFRPLQTIVIDRPFELDGNEMNLVALTYEENAYALWVIDILSDEIDEAENAEDAIEPCEQTNRDLLMRRDASQIRLIESIEVGKFGKPLFIASFQDVPNDHLETIDFELHSISKSYKEEHMSILPSAR